GCTALSPVWLFFFVSRTITDPAHSGMSHCHVDRCRYCRDRGHGAATSHLSLRRSCLACSSGRPDRLSCLTNHHMLGRRRAQNNNPTCFRRTLSSSRGLDHFQTKT